MLSGKESACQCRRPGFNPWVRKITWRRKWQSTPVFLPGESYGQRNLVGYSLDCKELDMSEHAHSKWIARYSERREIVLAAGMWVFPETLPLASRSCLTFLSSCFHFLWPLPLWVGIWCYLPHFCAFFENLKPTQQIGKYGGTNTSIQNVFGVTKKEKKNLVVGFRGAHDIIFWITFSNYFLIKINFHQKL